MEKLTEQEIKDAFSKWESSDVDEWNSGWAFESGAKFAEEKLAPKWIPCKQNDILPQGKYLLKLQNGIFNSLDKYIEIPNGGREIPYFYATHYLEIQIPEL